MRKPIKIFFSLFTSITIALFVLMNNVYVNSYDSPEIEALTIPEKIELEKCYGRLSMEYVVDYDVTWRTCTATGGSTWLFPLDFKKNYNHLFQSDISSTVLSKHSSLLSVKVIQNSSTDTYVYLDSTNGLKLGHASNGDGAELIIKVRDERFIERYGYSISNTDSPSYEISYKSINSPVQEYTNQYRFNLKDECTEIRIKNTDTSKDLYLEQMSIDTCAYQCTLNTFELKKDDNEKYKSSMQFVGRISKELYDEIITTYQPQNSNDIIFGMIYARRDKVTDEQLSVALSAVGRITYHDYCSYITEITYDQLKGYDEDGINVVTENPSCYQWGVSINNISYGKINTQITAIPYVGFIKENDDYRIVSLQRKTISMSEMFGTYYNTLEVNTLNRNVMGLLKNNSLQ